MDKINPITFKPGSLAQKKLTADQIRALCNADIIDVEKFDYIDGVTTADSLFSNRIIFLDRINETIARSLNATKCESVLVIGKGEINSAITLPRIVSDIPRHDYSKIVLELFDYLDPSQVQKENIHPSAQIHPSVNISVGTFIGENSVIEEGVYLHPNITIGPKVQIGRGSMLKSGCVIGQPGLGLYRDEKNIPRHMPHVGGVILGEETEIGALSFIGSGTIHPTILGHHVKIDDLVKVGHNDRIDARTYVVGGTQICGSVEIGADSWIGPNVSIRESLTIGHDAFVGIGSNVVESVGNGETVMGNPARPVPKKNA